jgi:hypothetical protein
LRKSQSCRSEALQQGLGRDGGDVKTAIARVLDAPWQRCCVHFVRNMHGHGLLDDLPLCGRVCDFAFLEAAAGWKPEWTALAVVGRGQQEAVLLIQKE